MKMSPLITNQRVLMWLCVCPAPEPTSARKKANYVAFTSMIFIANISALAATTTFFINFISIDLEVSLMALIGIVGFFAIAYIMIVALLFRHKINALFDGLAEIYKASKWLIEWLRIIMNLLFAKNVSLMKVKNLFKFLLLSYTLLCTAMSKIHNRSRPFNFIQTDWN